MATGQHEIGLIVKTYLLVNPIGGLCRDVTVADIQGIVASANFQKYEGIPQTYSSSQEPGVFIKFLVFLIPGRKAVRQVMEIVR